MSETQLEVSELEDEFTWFGCAECAEEEEAEVEEEEEN